MAKESMTQQYAKKAKFGKITGAGPSRDAKLKKSEDMSLGKGVKQSKINRPVKTTKKGK